MSASETEKKSSSQIRGLAEANNYLAVHLHRLLAKENGNVFFSPFSISTAMAMVLCAAESETEDEMRKVLGHEHAAMGRDDIISAFQQQMSTLIKSTDSYTLASANSVLCQKGFELKEHYKSVLRESFKVLLLEVDFVKDSDKIVKQINGWVEEKTNGMITELIDCLDRANIMVLVNAVYFKGSWLRKFDETLTYPQKFYNKGDERKAKTIDMMHMKESLPFVEKESFKALRLPYLGEEIAMLILLPHKKDGLKAFEARITPSFVEELNQVMSTMKVNVALPRFRLEYGASLEDFFKLLGIRKLFSSAQLGRASDSRRLQVSRIIHKAALVVNEEGSEAAAATIIMIRSLSRAIPEFIVDHPFAFVIYDTRSSLILFMGRVEDL